MVKYVSYLQDISDSEANYLVPTYNH